MRDAAEERIERNVLVVICRWVWASIWPLVAGVVLTLIIVGGHWLWTDYREVRERALHGQQLWEWVQVQNQQNQQKKVEVQGAPTPEVKK